MGILSVVNICLIHFLIQRVRGPFGIPTSHFPCFYTLFAQGFFSFYFLPLSLQQAMLLVTFLTGGGEHHNKSQSSEMKINDCLTQQSLKSGLNRTQKCLSNEKELQKHFGQIYSSAPVQISGIKLRDNVSTAHL